jgi:hypothetical protein
MVRARVELSVSYGDDLADCVAIVVLCAFHRSLAGANCEGIDSPPTAMARTPHPTGRLASDPTGDCDYAGSCSKRAEKWRSVCGSQVIRSPRRAAAWSAISAPTSIT